MEACVQGPRARARSRNCALRPRVRTCTMVPTRLPPAARASALGPKRITTTGANITLYCTLQHNSSQSSQPRFEVASGSISGSPSMQLTSVPKLSCLLRIQRSLSSPFSRSHSPHAPVTSKRCCWRMVCSSRPRMAGTARTPTFSYTTSKMQTVPGTPRRLGLTSDVVVAEAAPAEVPPDDAPAVPDARRGACGDRPLS